MTEIVIALIPLLALLASLLLGHYPGCDAIVRLAQRISPWAARTSPKWQLRPRAPRFRAVRGGLLIAFGLAQRPPPATP